ncbi:uncharacterized protein MYCFIDRAFT_169168 [Pseudocercospora fijiensis CIRAD86]|uniref:Uncharacterized protein n=1 Tax=Pseudocercospora fijiensis (strain CIRAD86) TaxID=383855 RepID=N1Q8V0_PSEFD|nr:uncharacterized protein MYCFIDRAFT_169168 [Pseudocercospora fijiensis CIRAD86]EME87313.1 hypothetical protein MYCFIDRAFT_169168 [Pseudocercospora fijiensis CIRAD86]
MHLEGSTFRFREKPRSVERSVPAQTSTSLTRLRTANLLTSKILALFIISCTTSVGSGVSTAYDGPLLSPTQCIHIARHDGLLRINARHPTALMRHSSFAPYDFGKLDPPPLYSSGLQHEAMTMSPDFFEAIDTANVSKRIFTWIDRSALEQLTVV